MEVEMAREEVREEAVEEVEAMPVVAELKRSHTMERERLGLLRQPVETVRLAVLSLLYQCRQLWVHVLSAHLRVVGAAVLAAVIVIALALADGPHERFMAEAGAYLKFAVWWVGLGVASSIGLGSGLHTFVLYLGPHVGTVALKAAQCGRVDFKAAGYDTPQWGFPASWQHKECAELGGPLFPRLPTDGFVVPISMVLLQVQLEAILWGIGTAIGELPPYFVSRAARLSGEKVKELEDLVNMPEEQEHPSLYDRVKVWGLRKFSQLGFVAILAFASIPNPLFDLAGLMCGHFLVPFWKFFLATLIGKAVIKTHIQTMGIILACNPHVWEALEAGLAWLVRNLPFLNRLSPSIMAALDTAKDKASGSAAAVPVKSGFTLGSVWNGVVQIMMIGFVASIITATAQGYLLERQKREVAVLVEKLKQKEKQQ